MDGAFAAIETTALSTWLRDDLWAFPFVLILHTIGLAFLVGPHVAIGARVLGGASGVPLDGIARYLAVAWAGFWLNAASGVLLIVAYPAKVLTNPLFFVKLALIGVAMVLMSAVGRQIRGLTGVPPRRLKTLAVAALACWVAAITAGRFLAYTYTRLTVTELL